MSSFELRKLGKFLVLALVPLIFACGNNGAPEVQAEPDGTFDEVLLDGRQIWGVQCASCHGPKGQGGRGAKLNDGKIFSAYPEPEMMIAVIANGKGQGMPAFETKISYQETEAVIRYIREVLN